MHLTASSPATLDAETTSRPSARHKYRFALPALAIVFAASIATAEPALRVLKGSNQQTSYASQFATPLTVWAADPVTQQSLSGVRIEFAAAAGIKLSDSVAVTDEHGLASVTIAGFTPGEFTVSAQVEGHRGTQVSFDGLVVNKAALTVVPADLATSLGDKVPAITAYNFQGFVNGDTEETALISGAPVLTTTAKDSSPHANYAIKGGVGTLSSPNYTFVAGFGTLAVAGPANGALDEPGSNAQTDLNAQAESNAVADEAAVRPALMNKTAAIALREPSFLAGLRGESGIFVQTAIAAAPAASHTAEMAAQVRNAALPKPSSSASPVAAASVRGAVTAKAVATPARISAVPAKTAVALDAPAAAANAISSYAGLSIRTALIVPGTK